LVLRPKLLEDTKYLIALLHSKDFIDYAQSSADKQFPRTSWNWISKYSFYLPEPSTRRKAGSLIWALQEAIELETEKISCLKEISEGVLERLASQELLASFNKMDSLHDEISKGWEQ
jgi:restriction endonuclease S subunit